MKTKRFLLSAAVAMATCFTLPAMAAFEDMKSPLAQFELTYAFQTLESAPPLINTLASAEQPLEAVAIGDTSIIGFRSGDSPVLARTIWPDGAGKVTSDSKVTDNASTPFEVGWHSINT